MKKLFIFLIGLGMSFTSLSQPCLPNGIIFNAQSQIDNFPTNYPNCTGIEGNVIINGSNIKNLYGINAITTIGGQLVIFRNDSLTNLAGLENLESVGGQLEILLNSGLNSLTGLLRLTSIGGNLVIDSNNVLPNLTGMDSLSSAGGNIQINSNISLTSVNGLRSLVSTGGDIGIWGNPILSDLGGFENLTSIGGELYFSNNNALATLHGLDSIKAESIHSLHIFNNPNLSTCAIKSICDFLSIPYMLIEIHDNAPGCNSEGRIDTICNALSVDYKRISELFSIYPNPVSTNLNIASTEKYPESSLSILDLQGNEIIKCPISDKNTLINLNKLSSGMYFLKITSLNTVHNFKLIKH